MGSEGLSWAELLGPWQGPSPQCQHVLHAVCIMLCFGCLACLEFLRCCYAGVPSVCCSAQWIAHRRQRWPKTTGRFHLVRVLRRRPVVVRLGLSSLDFMVIHRMFGSLEQLLGALTSRFVSVAACCRHLLSTGSIAVLTFGWQGVLRPRDMKLWQELMWELVLLPLLCIRICAEVVLPLNLIVL